MSGIHTIPLALRLDVDSMANSATDLLDASSLHTVLTMLEIIDSIEELSLLETLSVTQKQQVWEATPASTRFRLKQLRMLGSSQNHLPSDSSRSPDLINSALVDAAMPINAADLLTSEHCAIEETAAVDLQAQQEEIDLMLQEPLNLEAAPTVAVGDWIVLQAKPTLTSAELRAIWEVIEVQGNYGRILAQGLGSRWYPTDWMLLYPKPIEYVEPEF